MLVKRKRTIVWKNGHPHVRIDNQLAPVAKNLLGDADSNTKTAKNDTREYETVSLSLAPYDASGIGNVCAMASAGCADACLFETGHGWLDMVRAARIRKTVAWFQARKWFLDRLNFELQRAYDRATEHGKVLAVRLNVFSDIPWEKHGIMGNFPSVEFYDYTKYPQRAGQLLPNYWVTFSRSETNHSDCLDVLRAGGNVAAVYDDGWTSGARNLHQVTRQSPYRMPKRWHGFRTISGDETDLRFTDPRPRAVMLKLKARTVVDRLDALSSGFCSPGVQR